MIYNLLFNKAIDGDRIQSNCLISSFLFPSPLLGDGYDEHVEPRKQETDGRRTRGSRRSRRIRRWIRRWISKWLRRWIRQRRFLVDRLIHAACFVSQNSTDMGSVPRDERHSWQNVISIFLYHSTCISFCIASFAFHFSYPILVLHSSNEFFLFFFSHPVFHHFPSSILQTFI